MTTFPNELVLSMESFYVLFVYLRKSSGEQKDNRFFISNNPPPHWSKYVVESQTRQVLNWFQVCETRRAAGKSFTGEGGGADS